MFKSLNCISKNKGGESFHSIIDQNCWISMWLNKQTIVCHQLNRVRTLWLSSFSERKTFDAFHNKYPFIKCAEMNKKDLLPIPAILQRNVGKEFRTSKIEKYQLIMKMAQIMCYILSYSFSCLKTTFKMISHKNACTTHLKKQNLQEYLLDPPSPITKLKHAHCSNVEN